MLPIKFFNGETLQMFTGNLLGSRMFFLQYQWESAVRIKKKPFTPQRKRLCILWENPLMFTDCRKIL